jgi:hypothetical protein
VGRAFVHIREVERPEALHLLGDAGNSEAIFIVILTLLLLLRTPVSSQVVPCHVQLVVLILELLDVLSVVLLQVYYHEGNVIGTALLNSLGGNLLAYLPV